MNQARPTPSPRLCNMLTAARYLGIGKSNLWDKIRDGAVPHVRLGTRVLLDYQDLDRIVEASKSTTWASVPRNQQNRGG